MTKGEDNKRCHIPRICHSSNVTHTRIGVLSLLPDWAINYYLKIKRSLLFLPVLRIIEYTVAEKSVNLIPLVSYRLLPPLLPPASIHYSSNQRRILMSALPEHVILASACRPCGPRGFSYLGGPVVRLTCCCIAMLSKLPV
jgi:hypothetical protein